MTITDDELDAQLRALARPTPGIDPAAALSLTREATDFTGKRRRCGKWLIPTGLLAAGLLAIPTTAVATRIFEAQTGEFSAETTESEAGNEWVYTGSPDYEEYLVSIAPRHLPTPAGFSWEAEAAAFTTWHQNSYVEDATLICDFENTLWQAWIAEWIKADREGDDKAREIAMDVLREAPSWPNIASSDGGGIRYAMWAFVARMNVADPGARSIAAQALAERETGYISRADRLIELQISDSPPAAELLAARGPAFHSLLAAWDHRDRQNLITEILADSSSFSTHNDTSAGSPYWDDYGRALIEIATAAGVPDPAAAVGRSRLGPNIWKGEVVWNGDLATDGDAE
ncbi:hypothetical protein G7068_15525 [Leucobacter viscericola]|uniref:Uncharacterized protein n=1 Tax=Leucobacter viscericola TaxID=2714935 RepID=A0A6G7XJB5_9MICO|nr:hypothetical protein [Leucobacter viscericola]QIK64461.1 hypothetical protein G7068_15525 [Leucobacter viscericola]